MPKTVWAAGTASTTPSAVSGNDTEIIRCIPRSPRRRWAGRSFCTNARVSRGSTATMIERNSTVPPMACTRRWA